MSQRERSLPRRQNNFPCGENCGERLLTGVPWFVRPAHLDGARWLHFKSFPRGGQEREAAHLAAPGWRSRRRVSPKLAATQELVQKSLPATNAEIASDDSSGQSLPDSATAPVSEKPGYSLKTCQLVRPRRLESCGDSRQQSRRRVSPKLAESLRPGTSCVATVAAGMLPCSCVVPEFADAGGGDRLQQLTVTGLTSAAPR